jgi:futalosine hydrolase
VTASEGLSPVALLCAVPLEAAPLLPRLRDATPLRVGRRPATTGSIDGMPVLVLAGGMGKTNAAQATTALLERHPVAGLIGFGVAGAFAGSGLDVGDVALATAEHYGDEGVAAPGGWISTAGIGIPLLDLGGTRRFNEFPLDAGLVAAAERVLRDAGVPARSGPFATVSCCSGTRARADELAARFSPLCETMEGAAVAHVCEIYGVPFLEVRGVSNHVTDRDLSSWRLHDAAHAAAGAAALLAAAWSQLVPAATRSAP